MSIPARQSTAIEIAIGPVLDADGVAVTDCVVGDFKLKKTTGNFAALNGSATLTHVSAGMYDLVLTTSDTDTVGLCTVAIDDGVNACAPVRFQVIEEAVYDALYAASAAGPLTTLGSNAPAGWINEAAFANNAITDAKVASDVTIASVTNAVTVGTNNDKTGYSLATAPPTAAAIADAVLDEAMSGHTTAGTLGKYIADIFGLVAKFSGITSVASWLGALAGKTADTSTRAEINATTAGAGYNETTDSLEAAADSGVAQTGDSYAYLTTNLGVAGANATEAGGTGDQFTGIASVGAVAGNVGGVAGTTQTLDALATLIRGADGDTLKTISDQIDAIPTTIRVKKNAALAGFPIVMIDTSGDPATGKTVTGTVSLDGGAFTSLTNSISEVSGGLYTVNLAAGDTNGNTLVMRFSATGCRTRFVEIVTQP